jgi:hypothetical protein
MNEEIPQELKFDPNQLENEIAGLEGLSSNQTIDESLAQAISVLTEEERKKLLSQIERKERFILMALYAQAREFDDDLLQNICDQFLILGVSENRQGRKEIVEIAKANLVKNNAKGILAKLLRRGGGSI